MQQLPPDQRAVLSLVLAQGRSYADVASALGMSEQSVRERAHAALDALAAQTAPHGASAPPGRDSAPTGVAQGAANGTPPAAAPAGHGGQAHAPGFSSASEGPSEARAGRGSRTGGAILLGAIVVAVAVGAIVLSSGGKGPGGASTRQTARQSTTASTTSSSQPSQTSQVRLDKRFPLAAADPASKASGEGLVVSQGKTRAFYVTAQGLPPSKGFFYAVWLYTSQAESWPLGRTQVGSNGVLEGGGPLNVPHLSSFHKLVITRETNAHPSSPGPVVMSGPFALR